MLRCSFCGRDDFKSQHGLSQHQNQGLCNELSQRAMGLATAPRSPRPFRSNLSLDVGGYAIHKAPPPPQKQGAAFPHVDNIDQDDLEEITHEMGGLMEEEEGAEDLEGDDEPVDSGPTIVASDEEDKMGEAPPSMEEEGPITQVRDQFKDYVEERTREKHSFTPAEISSIRLLHLLKKKGAALNTYPEVMEWHLRASHVMEDYEQLKDCDKYISRERLMKSLKVRYNMSNKYPYRKKIKLPVSGTIIRLTLHDPGAVLQSLLTDPHIQDEDYCFFGDDPLAPPPDRRTHVGELVTGTACRDTHKKMIDPDPLKRQQLLPVPLYIDGSAVSHFHNMEIIPVKMTLGIFKRSTRTKDWAWRFLGFIEKVHEQGGRGRAMWREADHMEVDDGVASDEGDSDLEEMDLPGIDKKQDLHAMLVCIFERMKPFFKRGFLWDLPYKGVLYRDIHYKLFIPYVKCDTKEAEDLCGKYGIRTGGVKCLCRYCDTPVKKGDRHLHECRYKTEPELKKMVQDHNLEGLKLLSQHFLWNAFWDLPFNAGNKRGIHGACPMDMLHAIQLGIFSCVRTVFFEMIGETSAAAKDINGLSKEYGRCFSRQSDASIPNARFSKGIQEGKLMGKEYRGILLLMLVMLHSGAGRSILKRGRASLLKEDHVITDWSMVVELLLLWEAFLLEEEMSVRDVNKLRLKNRYIMYLLRKVARRKKGMALKVMKFHGILHLADDILLYGVPLEADTSANESHHKPIKKATKLTQMDHRTFNLQTATRMVDFEIIEMAMLELEKGLAVWLYYQGCREEPECHDMEVSFDDSIDQVTSLEGGIGISKGASLSSRTSNPIETIPGDAMIKVFPHPETGDAAFKMVSRSFSRDKTVMNGQLVEWLLDLQDKLNSKSLLVNDELRIYTRIKRADQSFRAHPNYRGIGPWRDWAWVNFSGEGGVLCHMWCFVVIPEMEGHRLSHGHTTLEAGVYAVVECATEVKKEQDADARDIIFPVAKEVLYDEKEEAICGKVFYLADTDAIAAPACVVPDIGGPPNQYFYIEPREMWSGFFADWLHYDLKEEEMVMTEDENEDQKAATAVISDQVDNPSENVFASDKEAESD